jgi:hypothetical protein
MFTQMEWHVLQTLNWIIGHPTVTGFLQLALTEGPVDPELEHMAWYISEIALYHKEFIPVRPSTMARSSLALARCILNRPMPRYDQWSAEYDPQVVLNISNHLAQPSQALSRKYASHNLSSASTTVEMFLKHQAALATRIAHTPVNSLPSMDTVEGPTTTNPYLTPQTPQKIGFSTVPAGVITPPITPDKDFYGQHYANQTLIPRMPCTPTPPPSGAHQMLFAPNHVPAPPQFIS